MALRLPTSTRNAMVTAATALADAGPGAATIKVYTGTQPASANNAVTGTLLVTFTLNDPAYGTVASGVAALGSSPTVSATAAATGTAGWARLADSAGNTVYDGVCGTVDTEFILNSLAITAAAIINLTAGSLGVPSGEV